MTGGSQIPAPAMWNLLIERNNQSSLIYLEFAVPVENSEHSDCDFFNGIGRESDLPEKPSNDGSGVEA